MSALNSDLGTKSNSSSRMSHIFLDSIHVLVANISHQSHTLSGELIALCVARREKVTSGGKHEPCSLQLNSMPRYYDKEVSR
jgi:hypothetical protein